VKKSPNPYGQNQLGTLFVAKASLKYKLCTSVIFQKNTTAVNAHPSGEKIDQFGVDVTYDQNFLRFLTILGEKISVFLKNQSYDQIFAEFSFVLSQKRNFFANFFGENIFKIITSANLVTLWPTQRKGC
jgi:hypothetical protein